jgi:uncharacterized protein (TIGR03435 family)
MEGAVMERKTRFAMPIFAVLVLWIAAPAPARTSTTFGFADLGLSCNPAIPSGFPYQMSSEEIGGDHPSIFTIVEELGLKLDAKKLPFDVIVVDRGNKVPIEN